MKGEVKDAAMKFLVPDTCVKLTHKLVGEATGGWARKVLDAATFLWDYSHEKHLLQIGAL